ncbi:hypothetical protein FHX45_001034 [Amycolatopsis granulosa]|nr:hypothetical protein [Amycolatopsis granulosa]
MLLIKGPMSYRKHGHKHGKHAGKTTRTTRTSRSRC